MSFARTLPITEHKQFQSNLELKWLIPSSFSDNRYASFHLLRQKYIYEFIKYEKIDNWSVWWMR